MRIPLSESEFRIAEERWQNGMLIQDAFPMLNANQREFIMTGSTHEEWDSFFLKNSIEEDGGYESPGSRD